MKRLTSIIVVKVGKIGYFIESFFEEPKENGAVIECDVRGYEYKAENEEEEIEVQKLIREAMQYYMAYYYNVEDVNEAKCNFYNFVEGRWGNNA